jgi:menaquinone-dependent protoporphyrinogen oxidase
MNILILYGSLEGQTKKIAEYVADMLRQNNHQVSVQPGEKLPDHFSVINYDAAIIGGPIHMGKYPACINSFVATNIDWLNNIPSAFFTVCMAINSTRAESRERALQYGMDFLAQAGWCPRLNDTFSGAVKYTQYNLITRFIMKMISKREGGNTDTSQDHEYTDWAAVKHFTKKFMEEI